MSGSPHESSSPGAIPMAMIARETQSMRLRYFLMGMLVGAVVTGAGFALGKLV